MRIWNLCEKLFESAERCPCFGKDAEIMIVRDVRREDFLKLTRNIEQAGFVLYTDRNDARNSYATYTCNDEVVNVSFTKNDSCIRVVGEISENLPPRECDNKYKKVTTPLITQMHDMYVTVDCGMSYLIRLSDGRFVMIDGGIGEYDEIEHLYHLMCDQNVRNEGPLIAAWFITHAHGDHFYGFNKFCDTYGDRVIPEYLIYNWPNFDMTARPSNLTDFNRIVEGLTETKKITARSGQRFCFADATFDVLFVCEDLYPDRIPNLNDTSMVTRMKLGNYTTLWLGDIQGQGSALICNHFTDKELKCDFLQVGHHGYGGGSPELYAKADPTYLLWPAPDFQFRRVKNLACNDFLMKSKNIKSTFLSGHDEFVIDLTQPIPEISTEGEYPNKRVIYSEDFSNCSPFALNWSSLTGGKCGYAGIKIDFHVSGECVLKAGERYSVCEILRPGLCKDVKDYTMNVKGKTNAQMKVGLFLNYADPFVWSDDEAVWLDLPKGNFEFCAKADSNIGTIEYSVNGEPVLSRPYTYKDGCGIYIILQNAEFTLTGITINDDSFGV